MKTVGVMLIILGIFALAYQGITYTSTKPVAEVGGLQVNTTGKHSIPLPPILGGLSLAAGIILVIAGASSADNSRTRTTVHTTTTSDRGHPSM